MKKFITRYFSLNLLLCVLLPSYLKAQNCPADYEGKNFSKQIKKDYTTEIISVSYCKQVKGSEVIQKVFFTIRNNTNDQLNIWLRFGIECKDAHEEYVPEDSMLKILPPKEQISGYGDNADAELSKEINQDVSSEPDKIGDITLEIFSISKVVDGYEILVPSVSQQKTLGSNPIPKRLIGKNLDQEPKVEPKPVAKEEPKKEPEVVKQEKPVESPPVVQQRNKSDKYSLPNIRKGYLGFGLGPSIFDVSLVSQPYGQSYYYTPDDPTLGIDINLSFGYRFGKHFGMAGLGFWGTTDLSSDINSANEKWNIWGVMPGIYFSSSPRFSFVMRLLAGYISASVSEGEDSYYDPYTGYPSYYTIPSASKGALAIDFGVGIKTSSRKPVSFLLNLDYKTMGMEVYRDYSITEQLSNKISIIAGLGINLK